MFRIRILVFLLFSVSSLVFSQDDMIDDLEFEEIPVVKEKPTYFAIGAGYLASFNYFNYDEMNIKLKNDFNLPEYSGPMFVSGAHGFTGIGIIPNLRIGFFGLGGSNEVSSNMGDTLYGSKLSASMTGFSFDYGFVLFEHFSVLPGVQIGWSSLRQNIYRTQKTSWEDVNNAGDGYFFSKNIEGSFWFAQPTLYLEYALTPFLMAQVSAGYSFDFYSSDWKYNNASELTNVPSGINTTAMTLRFGIFVGLFNF